MTKEPAVTELCQLVTYDIEGSFRIVLELHNADKVHVVTQKSNRGLLVSTRETKQSTSS